MNPEAVNFKSREKQDVALTDMYSTISPTGYDLTVFHRFV
jgi:hypothetical protein